MNLSVSKFVLMELAMGLVPGGISQAHAGTPSAKQTDIPAIVARALPSVASITTRRIERDQFNGSIPKTGVGSGIIVDRYRDILANNHVVLVESR